MTVEDVKNKFVLIRRSGTDTHRYVLFCIIMKFGANDMSVFLNIMWYLTSRYRASRSIGTAVGDLLKCCGRVVSRIRIANHSIITTIFRSLIKWSTNRVVAAAAVEAWPAVAERTAAARRTETLPASPAQSHSWPSPASAAVPAAPAGFEVPSLAVAPGGRAPRRAAADRLPGHARAPHPAPGHDATLSAAPSPVACLRLTDTSRSDSCGTCSTACGPLALSSAGGYGIAHSSAARAVPPSWRLPVPSAPRNRRACGASTRPRTPWLGPRFRPCSRRIRWARNERTRGATRGYDATACPRRRHDVPRPAPHPAALLHLLLCIYATAILYT